MERGMECAQIVGYDLLKIGYRYSNDSTPPQDAATLTQERQPRLGIEVLKEVGMVYHVERPIGFRDPPSQIASSDPGVWGPQI